MGLKKKRKMPRELGYSEGGLSIRNFYHHNYAMFAKIVQRLLSESNIMFSKVLKNRYFSEYNLLIARTTRIATPLWRYIIKVKNFFLLNFCWQVRDPCNINIWMDPQVPNLKWLKPIGLRPNESNIPFISNLLVQYSNMWDLDLLNTLFLPREVDVIRKFKISINFEENVIIRKVKKNMIFNVKSAHAWMQNQNINPKIKPQAKVFWNKIWKIQVPERIKLFVWKLSL